MQPQIISAVAERVITLSNPGNSVALSNSKRTLGNEIAWKIGDALWVLRDIKDKCQIILGGDILREDMSYTYDNWYYLPNKKLSEDENIHLSYEQGIRYLSEYMQRNGCQFYVVIVVQ